MKVLLDTHAWVWATQSSSLLTSKAKRILADPNTTEILISSISIWEVSKLHEKKRVELALPLREWFSKALEAKKIRVIEISPAIAIESTQLPGAFHGDPADQIIVATGRIEKAILLTKDKKVGEYRGIESFW